MKKYEITPIKNDKAYKIIIIFSTLFFAIFIFNYIYFFIFYDFYIIIFIEVLKMAKSKKKTRKENGKKVIAWILLIAMILSLFTMVIAALAS